MRRNLAFAAILFAWAAEGIGGMDVLCIYYPEWHVYPEGEAIFGKGRTEWDYVDSAIPRFPGHEQPLRLKDGHPDDATPADVFAKRQAENDPKKPGAILINAGTRGNGRRSCARRRGISGDAFPSMRSATSRTCNGSGTTRIPFRHRA